VKAVLERQLSDALAQLIRHGRLPATAASPIQLSRCSHRAHGHFTCRVALHLASLSGVPPHSIAKALVAALPENAAIAKMQIVAPGYINFFLTAGAHSSVVRTILEKREQYGRCVLKAAEPTAVVPLLANSPGSQSATDGRVAAVAAVLTNVLRAAGSEVQLAPVEEGTAQMSRVAEQYQRGTEHPLLILSADEQSVAEQLRTLPVEMSNGCRPAERLFVQAAQLRWGGLGLANNLSRGSSSELVALTDAVGDDAARFFFVQRKLQQGLTFDIALAQRTDLDNPLYRVQYAHARICSVFRQLRQQKLFYDTEEGVAELARLSTTEEQELLHLLAIWPDLIARAAAKREVHSVVSYLRDLANGLHTYYFAHKVLLNDRPLRQARLALLDAVKQVLINGLGVLDVTTPEVM